GSQGGVARHHHEVGEGERAANDEVLRRQRRVQVQELRHHGQQEDRALGVDRIDAPAAHDQLPARGTPSAVIRGGQRLGRRAPLLHAEVDEVGHARPLDESEAQRRRRDQRTQPGAHEHHLRQDAQDEAEGHEVAAPKAVAQARAHGRDSTRARRQADRPRCGEERQPNRKIHDRLDAGTARVRVSHAATVFACSGPSSRCRAAPGRSDRQPAQALGRRHGGPQRHGQALGGGRLRHGWAGPTADRAGDGLAAAAGPAAGGPRRQGRARRAARRAAGGEHRPARARPRLRAASRDGQRRCRHRPAAGLGAAECRCAARPGVRLGHRAGAAMPGADPRAARSPAGRGRTAAAELAGLGTASAAAALPCGGGPLHAGQLQQHVPVAARQGTGRDRGPCAAAVGRGVGRGGGVRGAAGRAVGPHRACAAAGDRLPRLRRLLRGHGRLGRTRLEALPAVRRLRHLHGRHRRRGARPAGRPGTARAARHGLRLAEPDDRRAAAASLPDVRRALGRSQRHRGLRLQRGLRARRRGTAGHLGPPAVDNGLMATSKSIYTCTECGGTNPKWLGKCPHCGAWNTLIESAAEPAGGGKNRYQSLAKSQPVATLSEIEASDYDRTPTGQEELDRVLGGGIVAGGRRVPEPDRQGALRNGRGKRRPGGDALTAPGPGWQPGARAGRDQPGEDPRHHRCRGAGLLRHRLHPDALLRAAVLRARLGRAGARVRGAAHPHGQGARLRDGAGGPCHQGRRTGRPARAGAHRRHGAVLRGRHAQQLPAGEGHQEPLRRGQRDRRLRDDREGPEGRGQPERHLPVHPCRAGAGQLRARHAGRHAAAAGGAAGPGGQRRREPEAAVRRPGPGPPGHAAGRAAPPRGRGHGRPGRVRQCRRRRAHHRAGGRPGRAAGDSKQPAWAGPAQGLHRLRRDRPGRRGAPRTARPGAAEGGGQAGLQCGRRAQGECAQEADRGADHPCHRACRAGHRGAARPGLKPPGHPTTWGPTGYCHARKPKLCLGSGLYRRSTHGQPRRSQEARPHRLPRRPARRRVPARLGVQAGAVQPGPSRPRAEHERRRPADHDQRRRAADRGQVRGRAAARPRRRGRRGRTGLLVQRRGGAQVVAPGATHGHPARHVVHGAQLHGRAVPEGPPDGAGQRPLGALRAAEGARLT
ncbi:hypothetical protein Lal_00010360, partial [Lupinus albus]